MNITRDSPNLLTSPPNHVTLQPACTEHSERELHIVLNRADLEREHSLLIARVHELRRLLGYPVLMTGKQERQQYK